jgi:hypothetical protein
MRCSKKTQNNYFCSRQFVGRVDEPGPKTFEPCTSKVNKAGSPNNCGPVHGVCKVNCTSVLRALPSHFVEVIIVNVVYYSGQTLE